MRHEIYKVGAVIVNDSKQILVVRKTFKDRVEFIIPGGRQELGEDDEQTLFRELEEELGVKVSSYTYFGTYEEPAVFEGTPLTMSVYEVVIKGIPKPQSEIKEAIWIDRDYSGKGIKLGSVLANHVIPALINRGLL